MFTQFRLDQSDRSSPTRRGRAARRSWSDIALERIGHLADHLAGTHGADPYLRLVAPTFSSTDVRARIVEVDRRYTGSVVLTVEANHRWTGFLPGQYTQLNVEIDGVRHTRCYSMASVADGSRRFRLGIKAQPDGVVSSHLLAHAEAGQLVALTPAAGDFHLPDRRPDRIVLISGGSGITPVMSMLSTLCAEGHQGPIGFLHYASDPGAALFTEDIDALARRHPNVTVARAFDAAPDAGDLRGLFDVDHIAAVDPDWVHAETYVCGPEPLMAAVAALHQDLGRAERCHREAFTLPQFLGEAPTVGGTIECETSGISIDNDGRPLLDQAERAGLNPTSGCRAGICHTCTRSLRHGSVRNLVSGELTTTATPIDIRICVNAPVGDVSIDL